MIQKPFSSHKTLARIFLPNILAASDQIVLQTSEEVDLVKPLLINDFDYQNENERRDGEKTHQVEPTIEEGYRNTWECGPAAYWYNLFDLENLIIDEKIKLAEKEKKSKFKKVYF